MTARCNALRPNVKDGDTVGGWPLQEFDKPSMLSRMICRITGVLASCLRKRTMSADPQGRRSRTNLCGSLPASRPTAGKHIGSGRLYGAFGSHVVAARHTFRDFKGLVDEILRRTDLGSGSS